MKRLFVLYIMIFFSGLSIAQDSADPANIVPNGGFEAYSGAPIGWFYKGQHFSTVMKYWDSPTGASPDVFGPRVRVPSHWAKKGFGAQKPLGGKSMVGVTIFGCGGGKPHCREYIQIQLKEPLVVGQRYNASFWVTHLPRSLQVNNLGMYFSTSKIHVKRDIPLAFSPQVKAEYIVSAKDWTKINGQFVAKEEAEYLIIGNFCPDSLTQSRTNISNPLNFAYYYIDEVKVKKLPPILEVPVKANDLTRLPLEKGQLIRLQHIYFDSDKWELLPRSYVELNKLLQIMRKNEAMVIEVHGHTDSMGDFDYNLVLSEQRARAVTDYLHSNGISRSRLRFKGFGSTRPLAGNEEEAGRQLNRRVEFMVLSK